MVGRKISPGIDVACGNAKVRVVNFVCALDTAPFNKGLGHKGHFECWVPKHDRPLASLPFHQRVCPANTSSIASARTARLR